jgi:phosphatidylserine decarboxylase
LAESFLDGYFVTIYLAPPDYHQIHSPVSGGITDCVYIQGNLWPVNDWSVKNIEQLFAINERVTTIVQSENLGKVAVVKVGATNVGAIRICYNDICANQSPKLLGKQDGIEKINYENSIPVSKGDKLGVFEMGSTVILLFEKDKFSIPEEHNNFKVSVGSLLAPM